MKLIFPVILTVKDRGTPESRKLVYNPKDYPEFTKLQYDKVLVHIGESISVHPTKLLFSNHSSINHVKINDWLKSKDLSINAELSFALITDDLGYSHFVFCE